MNPLVIIGALAGVLLVVTLVGRINAIFLFVALSAGELLSHYIGETASLALGSFLGASRADSVGPILLLWLPMLLAIFFLRKTLPASSLLMQIPPILLSCAAMALMTANKLPHDFQEQLYSGNFGHQLHNVQDIIIAGSGVLTFLLILLIGRPRHDHEKHGKRHHRG